MNARYYVRVRSRGRDWWTDSSHRTLEADEQARQQAEDAAYQAWRAMHRADVAPQHTIVLSSRRRDDGAA